MTDATTRSRTVRWTDPAPALPLLRTLPGLAYLEGLRDGTIAPPPMAEVINGTVVEVAPGTVTFRAIPGEEHLNPLGTVHGGFICTLLDTAAACAGHSTLSAGVGYTSIDLQVSYLRALAVGDVVTAVGRVVKAGSRVIFTEAVATDASGRTVATATSSLLVLGEARG